MGLLALLVGIFAVGVCAFIALRTRGPHLGSIIFHPIFFLGFFTALVGLDFFVLDLSLASGKWVAFSTFNLQGGSELGVAVLVFMIMTLTSIGGYAAGLTFSLKWPVFGHFSTRWGSHMPATRLPLIIFVAMAGLFVLVPLISAISERGLLGVAGLRQVFLGESLLYSLVTLCIVPAFFIFCADHRSRLSLGLTALLLCLFFVLIGTRGSVVMIGLGLAAALLHQRRTKIVRLLLIGTGLIWIGYFYTYASRFQGTYSSLAQFREEMGGPFDYIMNSSEMSIAESMMLHLNQHLIHRGPFDSLIGAAFAFVPRDIIPWKPLGFSAHMTSFIDIDRWLEVRSEWTVSGYVNAVYEMGVLGGALFNFLLFLLLGALFRGARSSRAALIFTSCCQIYLMLGYLRSDIHNFGVRLWAILVVLFAFQFGLYLLSIRRSATS